MTIFLKHIFKIIAIILVINNYPAIKAQNDSLQGNAYMHGKTGMSCVAKFIVVIDSAYTNTLRFNNISYYNDLNDDEIVKYYWDFGDRNFSNKENAKHTFQRADYYNVCLKIKIVKIQDTTQVVCESNYCRVVLVGEPRHYNLGGQVFAGKFPVKKGRADIYRIRPDNNYILARSMTFDTLGYFYFYQLYEGEYFIKITPFSTGYFPTYYGDAATWDKAEKIDVTKNFFNATVNLMPVKKISGPGRITGRVVPDNTHSISVKNINVILADEDMNPITFTRTDGRGVFVFGSVPFGKYKLFADDVGWFGFNRSIEISETNLSADEALEMKWNTAEAINDNADLIPVFIMNPYPNPATNKVNIDFKSEKPARFELEMFDLRGVKISLQDNAIIISPKTISIDISGVSGGIYLIKISDLSGRFSVIKKVIVY